MLGSTGIYEVWVKLVNLYRGTTPLPELQLSTNTVEYR